MCVCEKFEADERTNERTGTRWLGFRLSGMQQEARSLHSLAPRLGLSAVRNTFTYLQKLMDAVPRRHTSKNHVRFSTKLLCLPPRAQPVASLRGLTHSWLAEGDSTVAAILVVVVRVAEPPADRIPRMSTPSSHRRCRRTSASVPIGKVGMACSQRGANV